MIRFFDIFAGIGGFRSGLERAGGFECVGFCEIDKYAKQAYEALYDTSREVYYDDARKIDPDTMPDFDLICGGFPCQSFSIAGKRRGFDDTEGPFSLRLPGSLPLKDLNICCLKMFPDCYRMTTAGHLRPSSVRWMSWGTMSHGRSLTARIVASPKPERECSLSDFLDPNVPAEFCLSRSQIQKLLSNAYPGEKAAESTHPTD